MSSFKPGAKPQEKTIEKMLEWLREMGLSVYGNMIHEDGEVTGLHDFDAEMIVRLRKNIASLNEGEENA